MKQSYSLARNYKILLYNLPAIIIRFYANNLAQGQSQK